LHKRHVNAINIGALFPVHFDVHKFAVHDRGHVFVFERFVRHDMAPVTGGITNRKKDRFVFPARPRERFFPPWIPINRVMRVLKKIRRLLLRQTVGVFRLRSFGLSKSVA
jgi:hypothetical protein